MLCMLCSSFLQLPALCCIVIVTCIKVDEQHLYKVEAGVPGTVDGIACGSIEDSTQQETLSRPALICVV